MSTNSPTPAPPKVSALTVADRDPAIDAVFLGFSADPFLRWFWPAPSSYCAARNIIDLIAGDAATLGTGYQVADFGGVAMWLPPQHKIDEELLITRFQETLPAERVPTAFQIFDALDQYHPKDDCWYLTMIAVDPARQGQGLGSLLMKEAVARCDDQGLPAFLESSNPQNISLYERHGFEVMGTIQIDDSPIITPMIRSPR